MAPNELPIPLLWLILLTPACPPLPLTIESCCALSSRSRKAVLPVIEMSDGWLPVLLIAELRKSLEGASEVAP